MLILQNLSYLHPDKEMLFDSINLTINRHHKVALIGNNGVGKSTLLQLIAGRLHPSAGHIIVDSKPYYIPQIFGQYNHLTVAQALGVDGKLRALHSILEGDTSNEHFSILNDDWTLEERCKNALDHWQLHDIDLSQKMETLSGGQKTKVFLAGISIHEPDLVLLDEPSNHLDLSGREVLYQFIRSTKSTLVVVSHDKKLLNSLNTVCEMSSKGITVYGGNYDFYVTQKQIENAALDMDIQEKEKALRKAKEKERETLERQQKLDSRGKGKQEKAGVAKIMMNTLRNKAENSTAKIKSVHADKIEGVAQELKDLRAALPDLDKMKFHFDTSALHKGKILFEAKHMNYSYQRQPLWRDGLTFQIVSGERIALAGTNGSGKTTLLKLILGSLKPQSGTLYSALHNTVYIDQEYSLLRNDLSVYAQAQQFNTSALEDHQIKTRLSRFLFGKDDWDKLCSALSGGERMRLLLCCLTISHTAPDMIILDEPTNNLDIQNTEILTNAICSFEGTILVVSHDLHFLQQVKIERTIQL